MALTSTELKFFKEKVLSAGRILCYYDDDADGLASYLLVQKANPDVIGVRAARGPELDVDFARKVEENIPDLVLILDKPKVAPEFFDEVSTPTLWLDHHPTDGFSVHEHRKNVAYMNPATHNPRDHRPTSYWVWRALGGPLWLAAAGTTSDWDDALLKEFSEAYPSLAPKTHNIEDALFDSGLGTLIRTMNFILKGKNADVRKNVNALARIEEPTEIMDRSSTRGKFLHKQAQPMFAEYERQRAEAMMTEVDNGLYVHVFSGLRTSLVGEVANELMVRKEADIIIVGRKSNDEIKLSMRSYKKDLQSIMDKALIGVDGYGGGHKEACGGAIKEHDWERFLENVRNEL